jgi:cell division protein FtsN
MAEADKSSPWVWISLGLIIALFVAFVLFLDQKIVKTTRHPVASEKQQTQDNKPIFDFYTVLPERAVDIPEPDLSNSKPNGKAAGTGDNKVQFILQAGSFLKQADAEKVKAELAFLGLQSVVSPADVNGVMHYRVELGPYVDDGSYSQVKNLLIENRIDYIPKVAN